MSTVGMREALGEPGTKLRQSLPSAVIDAASLEGAGLPSATAPEAGHAARLSDNDSFMVAMASVISA
jgi:hypothetical protein